MKSSFFNIFKISMLLLIFSTTAMAAPQLDGIIKYSDPNDWGGLGSGSKQHFSSGFNDSADLTHVSVEEQNAGGNTPNNNNHYDVEELGVYINDNELWIGLQTQYNITGTNTDGITPGDFMFELETPGDSAAFSDNGSHESADFAFRFDLDTSDNTLDMIFFIGSVTASTGHGSAFDNFGTDWGISEADSAGLRLENAGYYRTDNDGTEDADPGFLNGRYSIEAAIDLADLAIKLGQTFEKWADTNEFVTMYWQPSCGNDFLAARSSLDYGTPGTEVPEPAAMLLFGMGLMGLSALGRRKQKIGHA